MANAEFEIERASGIWVWDTHGRRYIDGCASMWYANAGHGRDEVADAVAAQLRRLDAYTVFNDYGNPRANELADRLADLAPVDGAKVWLGSGGGDAIEAASKMARAHWILHGQPDKLHVIARRHSYHGVHGFGTSIGGIAAFRDGWGPLMEGTSVVAHDSVHALEVEVERVGAERVAAFFCEPVIGSGGVWLPPEGYLEGVSRVCAENNVLLVVDAVICGFGRLGTWFGIERWGIEPDLICFAKGVSSGFLPMGGVIASPRVAEPYWHSPGGPVLRHGVTYAGHPACCAAALATLEIYEREGLIPRGRELEGALRDVLLPFSDHPCVAEVRAGLGLMGAIELRDEVLARRPDAVRELLLAIRQAGVIVRPLLRAIAVAPPLTIETSELKMIGEAIGQGLQVLKSSLFAGEREPSGEETLVSG